MAWPKGVPRKPRQVPLEWRAEKREWGNVYIVVTRDGQRVHEWRPSPTEFWNEVSDASRRLQDDGRSLS